MTVHDIAPLRLASQCIGGTTRSVAALVEHMGALQAQDYQGALWSIGLRTGLTQREVVAAIEKRQIVRTWPQRGTLHFVPARDAAWHVALSADRLIRGASARRARLGLTDAALAQCRTLLTSALHGGAILTRANIMQLLEKNAVGTQGGRGYHILWHLSQTGVLGMGPMQGSEQTFVLLEEWVPDAHPLTREEGIAELAKRYFMSHGPATLKDFMWWSGLTSVDAKAGLLANGTLLVSKKVDGKEYWMKKVAIPSSREKSAYLLPGFDEYMLGYQDRSAALPREHTNRIVPGGNGMFLSTIVLDGQVVGTWKKEIKKDRLVITLNPFTTLTEKDQKRLEVPAKQYGTFLGLTAVMK